ncbi:MAG: Rne/Rng family ribonuclease, partial [Sciscionella sp.]
PILSEAEFLARRESVSRTMVGRERGEQVQMGVLEDGVLVEHFVTAQGSGSLVGNVYLGKVQNVLPSMEAAFVDIGRGRNAVLYAGEVDWDAAGLEGKSRKIEQALSTGDSVLVQVTKDPIGHKGARLTTQISLPGRFLVYVPGGGATGISRKLPDTERKRLKDILKQVVPAEAGVIIRTASEGTSEAELGRDVSRLQAQWEVIKERSTAKSTKAPELLYEEPDLLIKVVRDLFTEDFTELVVQGSGAWDTINGYVSHVAPELTERLRKHVADADVFAEFRIDEQILKALDRKVWLPSGGTLVIDRTEAMTVVDVNTGKFTGSGGNLEETVTRNNLEAAEEIVRQLRLRDIGGIIVVDFIDMVLEANRDLVLRRLTECLGRDRTRHQVAEVTSLGLIQMTRKRVGTGLLEAFSTPCEHCNGRGVLVSAEPVMQSGNGNGGGSDARGSNHGGNGNAGGGGKRQRGRGKDKDTDSPSASAKRAEPEQDSKAAAKAAERIAALSLVHAKATAATAPAGSAASEGADEAEPTAAAPGT